MSGFQKGRLAQFQLRQHRGKFNVRPQVLLRSLLKNRRIDRRVCLRITIGENQYSTASSRVVYGRAAVSTRVKATPFCSSTIAKSLSARQLIISGSAACGMVVEKNTANSVAAIRVLRVRFNSLFLSCCRAKGNDDLNGLMWTNDLIGLEIQRASIAGRRHLR